MLAARGAARGLRGLRALTTDGYLHKVCCNINYKLKKNKNRKREKETTRMEQIKSKAKHWSSGWERV